MNLPKGFQADPNKAVSNKKKHGVTFEEGCSVFKDPQKITKLDDREYDEDRYNTVGKSWFERTLNVTWTPRKDDKRLISARLAKKSDPR